MKRAVIVLFVVLAAAVAVVLCLPPLMHAPSPEETVPILASQELREFHHDFWAYVRAHGNPPVSKEELLADGNHLKGVVEPRGNCRRYGGPRRKTR